LVSTVWVLVLSVCLFKPTLHWAGKQQAAQSLGKQFLWLQLKEETETSLAWQ